MAYFTGGSVPVATFDAWLQPYTGVAHAAGAKPNYGSGNLIGAPPAILAARKPSPATAAAKAGVEHWFDRLSTERKNDLVRAIAARPGIKLLADAGDRMWLRYLWAFADAYHRGATEARDVALEWARSSPKFKDEPDFEKDWRSFKPDPNGITLATLLDAAVKDGFDSQHWKDPDSGDLPDGYRRHNNTIQFRRAPRTEDDVETWSTVIAGDVRDPILERVEGSYRLTFTYVGTDKSSTVSANQTTMPGDPGRISSHFAPMGITIDDQNAKQFKGFIVAWILKLRALQKVRDDAVQPFGWVTKNGVYSGLAVGGTIYRHDGSEEAAPGDDPRMLERYRPHGNLDRWKEAAALTIRGRPDLQVLVGASFGAPLVEHTGHSGFAISCYSRSTGVGKSSAFKIGTTVWGGEHTMMSLDDTDNAIHHSLGRARIMPVYWDEVQYDIDSAKKIVKTLFKLTQGRDKLRLNANITLREVGEWRTVLITAGNQPIMEPVMFDRANTDAGAVRLFEFEITQKAPDLDPKAANIIAQAAQNPGLAGRVYAKWLAQHTVEVRDMLEKMQESIKKALNAEGGERFYVAGIACILVGAKIARRLGLVDFDTKAMYAFMADVFKQLRIDRDRHLAYKAGGDDVEEIFSRFAKDHTAARLITTKFSTPGQTAGFKLISAPEDLRQGIAIHVAQEEKLLRFDKNTWVEWCRRRNFAPFQLIKQLGQKYGAYEQRGLMGAGTVYASARVVYVVLPITAPELADYKYETDSSAIAPAMAKPGVNHHA